ncbi:hypothetical protein TSUD_409940 [Trifolium subterraneum]|uniref:TF-B3 domain-containing protein n=1 Tax=Trifolium subterraneum TaxID=3900 RepID=A0A2Z6PJ07_TRISU|nr:hypothetical protein TSUD_409940 [Trifolium subterraneum]
MIKNQSSAGKTTNKMSSMFSTISRRTPRPEDIPNLRNHFDTIIDPNMEKIEIKEDFYKKWKSEFDKRKWGLIRGPDRKQVWVKYEKSNTDMKLIDGGCVSKCFEFVKPTRVTLSYVVQENSFEMEILTEDQSETLNINQEIGVPSAEEVIKPIMNPVPRENLQTLNQFENFETKHKETHDKETMHKSQNPLRMNDVKRKAANQKTVIDLTHDDDESHLRCQVNNSPLEIKPISRTVCRLALAEVTTIMLEIQENGVHLIKCPTNLQIAGRDQFEKFIYKEWKEYQQRSKIQIGDKILFKVDKPSLTLIINIIEK